MWSLGSRCHYSMCPFLATLFCMFPFILCSPHACVSPVHLSFVSLLHCSCYLIVPVLSLPFSTCVVFLFFCLHVLSPYLGCGFFFPSLSSLILFSHPAFSLFHFNLLTLFYLPSPCVFPNSFLHSAPFLCFFLSCFLLGIVANKPCLQQLVNWGSKQNPGD